MRSERACRGCEVPSAPFLLFDFDFPHRRLPLMTISFIRLDTSWSATIDIYHEILIERSFFSLPFCT